MKHLLRSLFTASIVMFLGFSVLSDGATAEPAAMKEVKEAKAEIKRLSALNKQATADQEIEAQLIAQYRRLGEGILSLGRIYPSGKHDVGQWVSFARHLSDREPSNTEFQLYLIDALWTFARHEASARPFRENWVEYSREGLAIAAKLRNVAGPTPPLRHALSQRLKEHIRFWCPAGPPSECAIDQSELMPILRSLAEDSIDDPRLQLDYLESLQSLSLEHFSAGDVDGKGTEAALQSVAVADRITDNRLRNGALLRSYLPLTRYATNAGREAEARQYLSDLVAALGPLPDPRHLDDLGRRCLAALDGKRRVPMDRLDDCWMWSEGFGKPCYLTNVLRTKDARPAINEALSIARSLAGAYPVSVGDQLDLIDSLLEKTQDTARQRPHCLQWTYFGRVAASFVAELVDNARTDSALRSELATRLQTLFETYCWQLPSECSALGREVLTIYRTLAEIAPNDQALQTDFIVNVGSFALYGLRHDMAGILKPLASAISVAPRIEDVETRKNILKTLHLFSTFAELTGNREALAREHLDRILAALESFAETSVLDEEDRKCQDTIRSNRGDLSDEKISEISGSCLS